MLVERARWHGGDVVAAHRQVAQVAEVLQGQEDILGELVVVELEHLEGVVQRLERVGLDVRHLVVGYLQVSGDDGRQGGTQRKKGRH